MSSAPGLAVRVGDVFEGEDGVGEAQLRRRRHHHGEHGESKNEKRNHGSSCELVDPAAGEIVI